MSRIGKRELTIPANVTVEINDKVVTVKGPKGTLDFTVKGDIKVSVNDGKVTVTRDNELKQTKQLHGTTNAIIANMITGVSDGFKKELEINGVGYRFQVSGNKLTISAGYSHPVIMDVPAGITVESPDQTQLVINGIDKEKVGEFAANVRKVRGPEPYKGKGIKYKDEFIRRKEGKKAA